jgi:hypothetical protein
MNYYENAKRDVVNACKKHYGNHVSECWMYGLYIDYSEGPRCALTMFEEDVKPLVSTNVIDRNFYNEMCFMVFRKLIDLILSVVDLDFTGKTPLELCQITCKSMFGD